MDFITHFAQLIIGLLAGFNIGAAYYRSKELEKDIKKALNEVGGLSEDLKEEILKKIQITCDKQTPLELFLNRNRNKS